MGILDIFKPLKKTATVQRYKELGIYHSTFSIFGSDIYKSEIVRACIRPLADYSAKAVAKCDDKRIENLLNGRPNQYMNGYDFIYKIRTRLELLNTAFIYIERNDRLQVIGLYPVPYQSFEAVEYMNGLFIKFYFEGDATRDMTLPWDDLAVVRKDYNKSDISGDDNLAIVNTLEMLNTVNQGLQNSIKATANLRGILKSTKAMLAPEAIKKQKDDFVKDYLNLENTGGIASLDSTQDFTPISINPTTASYEQTKEIRENIYRYFGVNDNIIMGNIEKAEELENFYKMRIAPFLSEISRELTNKIFNGRKSIVYLADQGEFMTMSQKIDLFNKVVLYNGMLVDEWRSLIGLGHIEGGDKPIMRLDAAHVLPNGQQMGREEDGEGPKNDESEENDEN